MPSSSREQDPGPPHAQVDKEPRKEPTLGARISNVVVPTLIFMVLGAVIGIFFNVIGSFRGDSWKKAQARERMREDTNKNTIRRALIGAGIGGVLGVVGSRRSSRKKRAAAPEHRED